MIVTKTSRKRYIFIISCISIFFTITSCQKNITGLINTTFLLDSVVSSKNDNVHLIYDNQQRVIEDIFYQRDTLVVRNVYQYNGINLLPSKKISYTLLSNGSPAYICSFQYNANGQKIADSLYYPSGNGLFLYISSSINYSMTGKINVTRNIYPVVPWQLPYSLSDTIYLNNSLTNIDSIRYYYSSPGAGWSYGVSTIFNQYNLQQNYFNSLNFSSCNFNSQRPIHFDGPLYLPESFDLEIFNRNYSTKVSYNNYFFPYQDYYIVKQFSFNADNLPVTAKHIKYYPAYNTSDTTNYRFVYY